MNPKHTMLLPSAEAAPKRRHFAVLGLSISARTVPGGPASLRQHLFPFAEALQRFRLLLAQPIVVPSLSDRLAFSPLLLPFRFCLTAAIRCARPVFAVPDDGFKRTSCCNADRLAKCSRPLWVLL